jgi:hypothetical protein
MKLLGHFLLSSILLIVLLTLLFFSFNYKSNAKKTLQKTRQQNTIHDIFGNVLEYAQLVIGKIDNFNAPQSYDFILRQNFNKPYVLEHYWNPNISQSKSNLNTKPIKFENLAFKERNPNVNYEDSSIIINNLTTGVFKIEDNINNIDDCESICSNNKFCKISEYNSNSKQCMLSTLNPRFFLQMSNFITNENSPFKLNTNSTISILPKTNFEYIQDDKSLPKYNKRVFSDCETMCRTSFLTPDTWKGASCLGTIFEKNYYPFCNVIPNNIKQRKDYYRNWLNLGQPSTGDFTFDDLKPMGCICYEDQTSPLLKLKSYDFWNPSYFPYQMTDLLQLSQ